MNVIKTLLVDDHEVVLTGYRRLLENAGDIKVIMEAKSGEMAYSAYIEHHPDVVVMDISMPGIGGLEAARKILQRDPKAKILIFSMHESEVFLNRALEAGALGYITKRSAATILEEAVRRVARGELFIAQEMMPHLIRKNVERKHNDETIPPFFDKLSAREFEIFMLFAAGKTSQEVADTLNLSIKTVSHHFINLKTKLNVGNVVELARLAIRHHLIEP